MKILRTLLPGQKGTKKYVEQFGEKLVRVRYRYDEEQELRMTTVELITDKKPWTVDNKSKPENRIVQIRIDYTEVEIRKLIKSKGGKWNNEKKVWEMPYRDVLHLGLEYRIV